MPIDLRHGGATPCIKRRCVSPCDAAIFLCSAKDQATVSLLQMLHRVVAYFSANICSSMEALLTLSRSGLVLNGRLLRILINASVNSVVESWNISRTSVGPWEAGGRVKWLRSSLLLAQISKPTDLPPSMSLSLNDCPHQAMLPRIEGACSVLLRLRELEVREVLYIYIIFFYRVPRFYTCSNFVHFFCSSNKQSSLNLGIKVVNLEAFEEWQRRSGQFSYLPLCPIPF